MVTNRPEYSVFLKDIYGCRVQKLNVNAGFTCPNRDGTLAHGGCIYCNNASFTPAFSTRPDCLNDDVLNLLSDINLTHPVIVEIGIESSHDRTLQLINRCHTWQCAHDAIEQVVERGITAGAHLILGLPFETHNDMLTTAKRIAELPLSTVKFHQLQVIKGTKLAQLWEKGQVDLTQWSASQYAAFCKEIIELLPPHMVIERMVSTAPSQLLLHPKWGLKPQQFKEIFQNIL